MKGVKDLNKKEKHDLPIEEKEAKNKAENNGTAEAKTEQPQKTEVEELLEKCSELNDRYLRTLAEYDNYRKRSIKERDAIYPEAKANTITEFLPIVDNFKRALSFECADTEFKKGMEMICHSFDEVFTKLGVEAIGEVGELFNPEYHNAVMHIEDEEVTESIVVEVFQQGYKMGERILRYAMVKVAN